MQDGRLVFTVEKREPNFYELALRRQNLDGGDYHPLYSQRGSIGYTQATYVTELSHKDFAVIFSNQNAVHGAGSLGVFNRSIGIDFTSTNPSDYPVIAGRPARVEDDFFLHSLTVAANDGSYTSPATLPDGLMLVSFGTGDPSTFGGDYDVYVMDPVSGTKTKLARQRGYRGDRGGRRLPARPEGHLRRPRRTSRTGTRTSSRGEPNADITVLDMTVLASLLFQNTPTGRVVEPDLPSIRRLRGPAAGRLQHARLPQQREPLLRQLRQRLRSAAPGRLRADQLRRLGSLRHPRRTADGASPGGRQRIAADESPPVAARGDDVPPGRECAPVLAAGVLQQPLRRVPPVHQRPGDRRGAQSGLPHAGVQRRRCRRSRPSISRDPLPSGVRSRALPPTLDPTHGLHEERDGSRVLRDTRAMRSARLPLLAALALPSVAALVFACGGEPPPAPVRRRPRRSPASLRRRPRRR